MCLYRILIAQKKKQFPVFAVKITFLMKKFLRQNKFRVVMFSVASAHYFLMFYHSINNPESRQKLNLYITKSSELLTGRIKVCYRSTPHSKSPSRGIFSIWQLFSIHVLTTPQGPELRILWPARPPSLSTRAAPLMSEMKYWRHRHGHSRSFL